MGACLCERSSTQSAYVQRFVVLLLLTIAFALETVVDPVATPCQSIAFSSCEVMVMVVRVEIRRFIASVLCGRKTPVSSVCCRCESLSMGRRSSPRKGFGDRIFGEEAPEKDAVLELIHFSSPECWSHLSHTISWILLSAWRSWWRWSSVSSAASTASSASASAALHCC
jgi:hypothetical protein